MQGEGGVDGVKIVIFISDTDEDSNPLANNRNVNTLAARGLEEHMCKLP